MTQTKQRQRQHQYLVLHRLVSNLLHLYLVFHQSSLLECFSLGANSKALRHRTQASHLVAA
jgi:hypothetical protein